MFTWVVLGIVLVVALGSLIVGRRRRGDVFSVLLFAGIAALAVAVMVVQVQHYRQQRALDNAVGASQHIPDFPAAPPPAADRSWKTMSPMGGAATGAAAPPAAQNPNAGR